jgi:hypothetical protein
MATESTAIVNLLDLVKNQKPIEHDSSDDMLFGGRVRFDPMAMPVPAQPVMLAPIPSLARQQQPVISVPLPQPFVRQPAPAIEQRTHRVSRVPDPKATLAKFALPVTLFCCAMVLLSVYLWKGSKSAPAPKTTIVHAPPPAPVAQVMPDVPPPLPPAPEAVAAAQPVVTPIVQKQPTVTEIQPTVPAVAETVPTVPTVPEVQPTVPTVADAAPAADEAEAPVAKPAKASKRKHHSSRAAKRAKKETRVATAEKPAKAEARENLGGKGALQISSSPARELWVDGKNTKKTTPQKVTLSPGTHNITLFDKKTRSAKTFQVEIKPNQTLRVSKSY